MQDNQLQKATRSRGRALFGLCLWGLLRAADVDASGTELEPGMHGYGLTVMEGTRIDTFGVQILGWERNGALPGRDRILVRLSGLGLEESGIVLGMSGSPVYVDDRLIGAVAYGWSFANEPVGLLTPIEEMLEVMDRDLSGDSPPADVAAPTTEPGWRRLGSPLWVSGAGPETMRLLTDLLSPIGLQPLAASGGTEQSDTVAPLMPGSAVGIQLVGGDLSITGIGTVTHVDGNRLVAFAHDLVGSGAIDVPFTTANIHGILSNQSSSFKLGSATAVVGAARQDRYSGVAGVTHERARTLPMAVDVQTATMTNQFSFDLARHRFYTTSLAQVALMRSMESAAKALGDASVSVTLEVELDDGRSLSWQRVYTGLNAPISAALEVGRPLRALVQSGFEDLEVMRIRTQVSVDERIHTARVDGARLDRATVEAGSVAHVTVHLTPFQASPHDVVIPIGIPADAVGTVRVQIGSGRAAAEWEQSRWPQTAPGNSDELLQRLRQPARDDELVVELVTEAPGLAVGGRELPTPPPSVHRLLTETHASGFVQPLALKVLARQRRATDYVLQGEHVLTVNITAKGTHR